MDGQLDEMHLASFELNVLRRAMQGARNWGELAQCDGSP